MLDNEIIKHFENNSGLTIECKILSTGEVIELSFESAKEAIEFFEAFKDQDKIATDYIYSAV